MISFNDKMNVLDKRQLVAAYLTAQLLDKAEMPNLTSSMDVQMSAEAVTRYANVLAEKIVKY